MWFIRAPAGGTARMMEAAVVFESAIEWLRDNYSSFGFVAERDIVWTLQKHLKEALRENGLSHEVFNDYPMLPGKRRSLSADLVVSDASGVVEVAAEFKFEPSHRRRDILPGKLPVVFWGAEGVAKDVVRAREYVERGKSPTCSKATSAIRSLRIAIDDRGVQT